MHYVSKIDEAAAAAPEVYRAHSTGFRRATFVDRAMGSVHMGVGVCFLEANGDVRPHFHSFEESFYVLEGSVSVEIGQKSHTVGPGDFGLIPTGTRHAFRSGGSRRVGAHRLGSLGRVPPPAEAERPPAAQDL